MMRKSFTLMFLAILFLVQFGCRQVPQSSVRWITLEELQQSLSNQPPMAVGFDVDDTVLFSSPGFYYGKKKYSPGSNEFLFNPAFWEEMNNELDRFSIPKEIARKLIAFHQERGDTIYFITARPASVTETLTQRLTEIFHLRNPQPVIFTGFKKGENYKIKPLRDLHIRIYYGDSDGDIEAAQANGVRGIRIVRAGNSTYKPLPVPGSLGEEVLADSEY